MQGHTGKHQVGQEVKGERKAWPEPSLWPPQEGMGEAGPASHSKLRIGLLESPLWALSCSGGPHPSRPGGAMAWHERQMK